MNVYKFRVILLLSAMMVIISACNIPGTSPDATEPASTEAVATEVSPAVTQEPAIQHNLFPPDALPEKESGQATDFDSSKILEKNGLIGGDRFTFGRFERPFNANAMDVYFSELDIVDTKVFLDDTWIFTTISLNELKSAGSGGEKYAIEIDDNLNGKGDWLIVGLKPGSGEWTVVGVQLYRDTNQDVGAKIPLLTDEGGITDGDGFETLTFDQGKGDDPDSAWIRISPNDSNTIEFAIKKSALGAPSKFMINVWAGTSVLDPANFDINDNYTHEQAGAADSGLSIFYPIKAVAEIDNSCRMAIGFQPTGKELGLCASVIPAVPGENPLTPSGCQATQSEIDACTSDASYSWNANSCSCVYTGPR